MMPIKVEIHTDFIALSQLLKFSGMAETGGQAKEMIEKGHLFVNGEHCLLKGKKIRPGDEVSIFFLDHEPIILEVSHVH